VIELSVVIPVYNEARVIEAVLADLERELVTLFQRFEVIVVDDASTDETSAILDRLAAARAWLVVRHAERNAGHGPSVVAGLERAGGDWILQLDSDGQFVVAELASLWQARDDADLVLGVRVRRHDPLHRLALSHAVQLVASALARRSLRDPNVPFRLMRRTLWEDVRGFLPDTPLAPSILVAVAASVRGWRIVHVPVTHLPRQAGRSNLRALRLFRFSLNGLGQLVAFRRALARGRPAAADAESVR
jgi:glycosyltransferase involved in cell wall biosynthesis